MTRYHIIEDGRIIGSTSTREEAIEMIKQYKARQSHWLTLDYYIIKGEEIFPTRKELAQ
jgi:hypothetical protein